MSLTDDIRHLRKKLRAAIKERQAAHSGPRRRKLARAVRRIRKHLEKLIKQRDAAPDWNGHQPVLSTRGEQLVRRANALGLYVTATTDGQHAPTSYHPLGRAIDFGFLDTGQFANALKFQRELAADASKYTEVFGPDNAACVKNGVRITLAEGTDLENQHDNHVHVAI